MTSDAKSGESYKPVKSILISQPKPKGTRNSFFALEDKFDIKIDWRQFIHVEPVTEKEFRKNRLRPDDFSAVIFTSRQSIDHFFRMCEEMRVKMSAETKYFCISKAVANYLQKFIIYRKRKVFVGKKVIEDLTPAINKHKDNLKFLLPCSNLGATQIVEYLKELKIDFQDVMMYRTLMSDLSDLEMSLMIFWCFSAPWALIHYTTIFLTSSKKIPV